MDYLVSLNKMQKLAVTSFGKPILIFAGAGSGKTRVLTHKIAYLVENMGMPPENILAVTFTNKAASEMKNRVEKLIDGFEISKINIGTFHSICALFLRKNIYLLDYKPGFTIYDQDDSTKLVKNVIKELDLDPKQYNHKNIAYLISNLKNKMISSGDYERITSEYREIKIAKIYELYQKQIKANNAVDFDDLLLLPLEIFDKYPEKLIEYQNKYQYVLVDEYQDTNKPQFEFIYSITKSHGEICVVGDDDQSIYGWRGADIQNILDFEKSFENSKIIKLEQNYRSTSNILNAAHSVVSKNINRADKKIWTENDSGELIKIIECVDEINESVQLLNNLKSIKESNRNRFSDFAILYRTNSQSRLIEDVLRRNAIPYVIVGGVKFYDRKEIKDVVAYLRLIVNESDLISFERIINFPARGLGKTTVKKIIDFSNKKSINVLKSLENTEEISIGQKQKNSIKDFLKIIKKAKKNIDMSQPIMIVRDIIESINLKEYYLNQATDDAFDRWANVNELLNSIEDYSNRYPELGLVDFLEEVSLLSDIDRWNDQSDAVTLMTLHSAKGLEFSNVFISGVEEGLFPLSASIDDPEQLEEERRLFYVGITRAEKKVLLSYANSRRRFTGERIPNVRSRFINEIPEEYLDFNKKISFDKEISKTTFYKEDKKESFCEGDIVLHKVFGKGKIINIQGMGDDAKITIVFSGNQIKKFISKYANLVRI